MIFRLYVPALACALACAACSRTVSGDRSSTPEISAPADVPALTTRHTSVFNKISYRVPAGWVVIDGETDWLAPRYGLFIGEEEFDPAQHAYYGVSVIFPHLSMDDMDSRRVRDFRDMAAATHHALGVASGATGQAGGPDYQTINRYDAAVIDVVLGDGTAFHQIFLSLSDMQIASVAAGGPTSRSADLRETVRAIAQTVRAPVPAPPKP